MRLITAKFSSRCAETGAKISKGETCLYDPDTKKVFTKQSETFKNWNTVDYALAGYVEAAENLYFDNFCMNNNI
jgi:hypothetical protein